MSSMSSTSLTNDDPALEHNYKGHKNIVTDLCFDTINKNLASSSTDNTIILWNLKSNTTRCFVFLGHKDAVTSLQFSPNSQLLASASLDRTVRLWVPKVTGKCTEFRGHQSGIRSVSFNSTGQMLLTGSIDKILKLWQVQRRRYLLSFSGHTNWVQCVRFSPDDNTIASCSDDRTLKLWDPKSGQNIHTFTHIKGCGTHIEFHPSGTAIGLSMNYGACKVYDLRANKLQQNYLLHDNATCLAWHPNGNFLLTSGMDGCIKIVDVLEGRPLYTLKSHEGGVNTIKFSKDGSYFATGGCDKHVMIWKTNFIMNSIHDEC